MEKSSQESTTDPDFQWGKFPPQESSFQLTRSMMEMRKPKAYDVKVPPPLGIIERSNSPIQEVEIPTCPITLHSIKLLRYVREVQTLMSKLNNWNSKDQNVQFDLSKSEYLTPPPYENPKRVTSAQRRSRSLSSGKSMDNDDPEEKILFKVPEHASNNRSGSKITKYPNLDEENVSRVLKKSVATVAAHEGFDEATSSALNVLTGTTENFLISFSKSLRNAADLEAETGKTPFFDCLDQALHESGCSSFKEIGTYCQDKIIKRHKSLKRQAEQLAKSLKSCKHPKKEDAKKTVKIAQDRSVGFSATYGKWTPVTGMSSTPFSSSHATNSQTHSGWVKSEPYDSGAMMPPSSYSFVGSSGAQVRPKSEYFEFSTKSENIELPNVDKSGGQWQ